MDERMEVARMRNGNQVKEAKRFTLIELMVVIMLIAILSSMLLPGLMKGQAKAHQVTCAGNLRQLAMAFQMYAMDFKMRLPPYVTNSKYLHGGTNWSYYILPYYDDTNLLDCPTSPQGAPEATREALHLYDGNYGWNFDGTQTNRGPITSFSKPSRCHLVFDSGDQCVIYGANNWENLMEELDLDWESGAEGPNRHNGRVNMAFLDGHVESLELHDFIAAPCRTFAMPWNIEWENGMLEAGTVPFPVR